MHEVPTVLNTLQEAVKAMVQLKCLFSLKSGQNFQMEELFSNVTTLSEMIGALCNKN